MEALRAIIAHIGGGLGACAELLFAVGKGGLARAKIRGINEAEHVARGCNY